MSNATPLAGIRVLTLEQFGAGPYGTMFMAVSQVEKQVSFAHLIP